MRGLTAGSILLVASIVATGPFQAQEHKKDKQHVQHKLRSHGGMMTMTKEFRFEVVFLLSELRIYGYDSEQNTIGLQKVTGSVTLDFAEEDRRPIEASLKYVAAAKGKGHKEKTGDSEHGGHHSKSAAGPAVSGSAPGGYLSAAIYLAKVEEGKDHAKIDLKGLPGKGEKEATIRTTVRLARLIQYACPMSCTEAVAKAGSCPKCGKALVEQDFIYACSMHPGVVSRHDGMNCWICGMKMKKLEKAADEESSTDKEEEDDHGHGKHDH